MGTFRGKKKSPTGSGMTTRSSAKKSVPVAVPQEFSDESDENEIFSDHDETHEEEDVLEEFQSEDDMDDMDEMDDDDDEEDDENEEVHWGKKNAFFKKGDDEGENKDEDDEGQDLEAEEALRLLKKRQASLNQEFLGIGESDEEEEEVQPKKGKQSKIRKQEEDDELLESEAPDVSALLEEFSAKAVEVKNFIAPALARLRTEEGKTKEGVAYLETKTHLLLSYLTNLTFYLLYRAEQGQARAESHPVVNELIKIRTLLDKLRPLDAKLKNELDDLVRRAVVTSHKKKNEHNVDEEGEEEDAPTTSTKRRKFEFRPDLNDLIQEEGDLNAHDKDDDDDDEIMPSKEELLQLKRAKKSKLVQSLLKERENENAPEEIQDVTVSHKEQLKRKYEEENYTRLPTNKKERKEQAEHHRKLAEHGGLLSTLAEEMEEDFEFDRVKDLFQKKTGALSMKLNEMNQARKDVSKAHVGGDDTNVSMPSKKTTQKAVQRFQNDDDEEEEHDFAAEQEVDSDSEHPLYKETVKRRSQQAKERRDEYTFPARYAAPEPVRIVDAPRPANREMIKNRGLTAHKSKEAKNPRKHLRAKYEAKVKARRGQVRDVRSGEGDAYQGERSGIRSNLVRSRGKM